MPTTSHPPRRSKSKHGRIAQVSPLKGIRLKITLIGAASAELRGLAQEKGLIVEERGGELSVTFATTSPEDALAQLRLLNGLLARKG